MELYVNNVFVQNISELSFDANIMIDKNISNFLELKENNVVKSKYLILPNDINDSHNNLLFCLDGDVYQSCLPWKIFLKKINDNMFIKHIDITLY